MIKSTISTSVVLSASTFFGCSTSSPERFATDTQGVAVHPQAAVSIAYMQREGGFLLNGEVLSRVSPVEPPDFIIDNDHKVWRRGPELSSCQGAFAVHAIHAFGTYYIPSSRSEIDGMQMGRETE